MPRVVLSEDQKKALLLRYEQMASLVELEKEFGHCYGFLRQAILDAGGKIRKQGRRAKACSVTPVLNNKLQDLRDKLGVAFSADVVKTVVDYALDFNDGRTFRKVDRKLGLNGTLSQFRKDSLEANYYVMGRLWRAVYRNVACGAHASDYGVSEEDLKTCLEVLTSDNIAVIKNWVASTEYVFLPNEDGVQAVVKACERTINTIVHKKLRFIYKYDPCYEKEDLASYLRIIAYKVATKYDWEMEGGKFAFNRCVNYTKRSLWNASSLLIKQNTSDEYRRLIKVESDDRMYQTTTVSIDDWNGSPGLTNASVPDHFVAEDRSVEVLDLVAAMGDEDPAFAKYLNIELDDDPEFNAYAKIHSGHSENDLYSVDYNKWRELAMRFCGITKASQRKVLKRRALKELGLWDETKVKVQEVIE